MLIPAYSLTGFYLPITILLLLRLFSKVMT